MSDAYYQERAKRRTRLLIGVGGLAAVVLCVAAGVVSLLYDACTRSFDRSPRTVVTDYVEAVRRGDGQAAQACWEHQIYYDLDAGCSEICLSRALGAEFQVLDVSLGSVAVTAEGRANLPVTVAIACEAGSQQHTGQILLDSVGASAPWKHWTIVHSTFGGTAVKAWCK